MCFDIFLELLVYITLRGTPWEYFEALKTKHIINLKTPQPAFRFRNFKGLIFGIKTTKSLALADILLRV